MSSLQRGWSRVIAALLLLILFSSCATHRVDWSTRVGNYTYDQAILDYGPPDKNAKLTDGTVVAEWLTRRGYTSYTYSGLGYGYPYYYYGPFYPGFVDTYSPDYFLRLIFSPDGKLSGWKKFAK